MRCKHWFCFEGFVANSKVENKLSKDAWEALRSDDMKSPFSMEKSIQEFEENCRSEKEYERSAKVICSELSGEEKIVSLGSGKGILEWHIKKNMPNVEMTCTDYTAKAMEQLKTVFPSVSAACEFDMVSGDYHRFRDRDLMICYRLSTEFTMKEWKKIFEAMGKAGVKRVIYVPIPPATLKDMLKETKKHIRHVLQGKKDTFCGWLYTKREIEGMWKAWYKVNKCIVTDNMPVYFLEVKEMVCAI